MKDTDLGDAYSQSASDGNEKETDTFMEFLRTCHQCGLRLCIMSISTACLIIRKRLGNAIKRRTERRLPIIYLLRGAWNYKIRLDHWIHNGRVLHF